MSDRNILDIEADKLRRALKLVVNHDRAADQVAGELAAGDLFLGGGLVIDHLDEARELGLRAADAGQEVARDEVLHVAPNTLQNYVNIYQPAQGAAMITFEIDGQEFYAMDGGPHFKFEEGMSLMVDCASQAEVDKLYDTLSEGGEKQPCGWVKDKFGVSWQIVPTVLGQLMSDPDREKAQRVTEAMLQMHKIDIAALERAYAG